MPLAFIYYKHNLQIPILFSKNSVQKQVTFYCNSSHKDKRQKKGNKGIFFLLSCILYCRFDIVLVFLLTNRTPLDISGHQTKGWMYEQNVQFIHSSKLGNKFVISTHQKGSSFTNDRKKQMHFLTSIPNYCLQVKSLFKGKTSLLPWIVMGGNL